MLTNLIEDNERPLSVIRETDSRNHNRESTKNQEGFGIPFRSKILKSGRISERGFTRRMSSKEIEPAKRHTISQEVRSRPAGFIDRRASMKSAESEVFTEGSITSRRPSTIGRRSTVGNKFKSVAKTQMMTQKLAASSIAIRFRHLLSEHFMNQITGDGRTFTGLPMTFYVPDYKPREQYENSYQTEPVVKFDVKNVKPQIEKAVKLFAQDTVSKAEDNVTAMCDRIREELKRFNYKRYRYIISGFITKNEGQGISIASKSLTDQNLDRSFEVKIYGENRFTLCTIHAIYLE